MALQNPMIPAPLGDSSTQAPAPATGLTTADLARLRHSLDSSISDNTKRMYNSAWRGFESWAQARGALAMPASQHLIAAYLAHLAEERRLSVATVRLHKAAIAAVHKAAGHPRSHRQRGSETHHAGHRAGPRKSPASGTAVNRRGPGRGESHGKEPTVPRWPGEPPGVGGARRTASPGGPGPAGHPAGRVTAPV